MMTRSTYGPREVRLVRLAARQPDWRSLSQSTKIRYAVSVLVNGDKIISERDLARVDQRTFTLARRLLSEAGAL